MQKNKSRNFCLQNESYENKIKINAQLENEKRMRRFEEYLE